MYLNRKIDIISIINEMDRSKKYIDRKYKIDKIKTRVRNWKVVRDN